MESCWLIEFEDGYKMIVSEELYKAEEACNWAGRKRKVEGHWFSYETCRMRNRGVPVFGF